ncbi:hypothetical protein [Streptomyces sp. NPDC058595]|uniref:hypothetical protein n=1 Tax=Streptomyces sp. NPDC058595 TaxID=3346550 RepID=UPI00365BB512
MSLYIKLPWLCAGVAALYCWMAYQAWAHPDKVTVGAARLKLSVRNLLKVEIAVAALFVTLAALFFMTKPDIPQPPPERTVPEQEWASGNIGPVAARP